ncbi:MULTISPECIES: LacI family DNA-binding transcriptional regulator [unclassified Leifsonia]|uniref:LacI family DNA-binding transcriptional regulator n=1 Tax=unclassified Leifsonia TaxID=2663824 RepID=UPI0008A7FD0A|nr:MULTISPECIES: LacI family DNA-binding transcriptional regulator [unclassified Leifsonia]SEI00535.1 DNA-binding transcriptional regulator, LacI/PurR family [Leifsonia sp. CL154]SFL66436.1 DNA-binding transcriptional regulator, LacI/PurR family [Leifsonia sp. CL147]
MPNNAPKPPVISDVARRAGVSVPTVSRVLNGAAYVSDEKRTRVMQAIQELDFRPSAAARALVARQPKLIAVIAGNTSRYGYAETIRGVEERARAAGYTVSITVVESADDDIVEGTVSLVLDQPIAGVVVLKFDPPGVAALHRIPKSIPTVSISGVRESGVPQAVLAEAEAAEEVTAYLLELGHATVHHVRVPPSRKEDGRTTGWKRALTKHGAPVPAPVDATWEPESGREIGRALADDPTVTAVFCGNDEIAMGVIRGLVEKGKRVPDDVSVVGFDDHPLARMWSPPLTTVDQDFVGLGSRAYDLLEAVMAGGKVRRFSSERPTVIIRESTAPPPA